MNPADLPLRDIHLPAPVGWWPLAPGWWALALLAILAVLAVVVCRRWHRRTRLRRVALGRLAHLEQEFARSGDERKLASQVSVLLRRLCISLNPRGQVAGLTGEAWLRVLDSIPLENEAPAGLSQGIGRRLLDAPYRPQPDLDGIALLEACRAWIAALPARDAK